MPQYIGPRLQKPTVRQQPQPGSPPINAGPNPRPGFGGGPVRDTKPGGQPGGGGGVGLGNDTPAPIPHGGPMPPTPGTGFQNPNLRPDGTRDFRAWPTNPRPQGPPQGPPQGGPPSGPIMAGGKPQPYGDPRMPLGPGFPRPRPDGQIDFGNGAIGRRGMLPPGGRMGQGGGMLPPGYRNGAFGITSDGSPLMTGTMYPGENGYPGAPPHSGGRPQWDGDWDPRAPWNQGPVQHGDGRNQQTGQPLTGATGQSGYPDWFEQGISQYGMSPEQAAAEWTRATGQPAPTPPQRRVIGMHPGMQGYGEYAGQRGQPTPMYGSLPGDMPVYAMGPGVSPQGPPQGPPQSTTYPAPYNPPGPGGQGQGGGSFQNPQGPPMQSMFPTGVQGQMPPWMQGGGFNPMFGSPFYGGFNRQF